MFAVARRSPTVRERRLARALRHLREEAGRTIEEVAEKLEMSASTVSRIETAQVGVRPRDLRLLLDIYEVTEAERDQLLQIARERRQPHWWQEYVDLPNIAVASLEDDASTISQYSTQLVPGLLQTEAYARGVLEAIRLDAKADDIDRRLELRLHRQARLTGEDAPEYWVVLDEAVVRRGVGGPAVMAADRGGQAAEGDAPGAAVHQRRARRDGRRVHHPPLSRVRRSRCCLHREHRERPVPRSSRGDP
jgi:transcriptional regulator with XRE-family HTH domain